MPQLIAWLSPTPCMPHAAINHGSYACYDTGLCYHSPLRPLLCPLMTRYRVRVTFSPSHVAPFPGSVAKYSPGVTQFTDTLPHATVYQSMIMLASGERFHGRFRLKFAEHAALFVLCLPHTGTVWVSDDHMTCDTVCCHSGVTFGITSPRLYVANYPISDCLVLSDLLAFN